MMGDLAIGSPVADPASKETRSFPSSARLLAPKSRSPVLLFFGSVSVSNAPCVLSSFETTCRIMPGSTREDQALVDEQNTGCRLFSKKKREPDLSGHVLQLWAK